MIYYLYILCSAVWVHYSRTHDIHEIRISRHVYYIISASRVSQLYAYGASRVPKQHKYDIIYPGAAQDYTRVVPTGMDTWSEKSDFI